MHKYSENTHKELVSTVPRIAFCLISTFLSSFLKTRSARYEASLMKQEDVSSSLDAFTGIQLFSRVLTLASGISMHWVVSVAFKASFSSILSEYFRLTIAGFKRIGTGSIHCLILRRSNSFCEFLGCLTVKIIPKIVLLAMIIIGVMEKLPFKVVMTASILLVGVTSLIIALQYTRSRIRRHMNIAYEHSNSKRVEIIENYERITAYDTLSIEIEKYFRSLERYTTLRQLYTCACHVIFLVAEGLLLLFAVFLWNMNINHHEFSSMAMMTENLKECIYFILKEIDTLLIEHSNYIYTGYNEADLDKNASDVLIDTFTQEIQVKSLSVSLGSQRILKDVSFTIKKGEKVAIIGPNSSGKTLLISALLGVIEYEGSVAFDGFEVKCIGNNLLNRIVSYVPQNSRILNVSIKENLLLGAPDTNEEQLIDVCDQFKCHSIFKKLGYSKEVGDGGKKISGGQRQRIILLSAILRDRSVLVIDDAFTGLDQKSEEAFVKSFKEKFIDKTVICSVHDMSMLKYFDEIIFLSNGTAVKGSVSTLSGSNLIFKKFLKTKKLGVRHLLSAFRNVMRRIYRS